MVGDMLSGMHDRLDGISGRLDMVQQQVAVACSGEHADELHDAFVTEDEQHHGDQGDSAWKGEFQRHEESAQHKHDVDETARMRRNAVVTPRHLAFGSTPSATRDGALPPAPGFEHAPDLVLRCAKLRAQYTPEDMKAMLYARTAEDADRVFCTVALRSLANGGFCTEEDFPTAFSLEVTPAMASASPSPSTRSSTSSRMRRTRSSQEEPEYDRHQMVGLNMSNVLKLLQNTGVHPSLYAGQGDVLQQMEQMQELLKALALLAEQYWPVKYVVGVPAQIAKGKPLQDIFVSPGLPLRERQALHAVIASRCTGAALGAVHDSSCAAATGGSGTGGDGVILIYFLYKQVFEGCSAQVQVVEQELHATEFINGVDPGTMIAWFYKHFELQMLMSSVESQWSAAQRDQALWQAVPRDGQWGQFRIIMAERIPPGTRAPPYQMVCTMMKEFWLLHGSAAVSGRTGVRMTVNELSQRVPVREQGIPVSQRMQASSFIGSGMQAAETDAAGMQAEEVEADDGAAASGAQANGLRRFPNHPKSSLLEQKSPPGRHVTFDAGASAEESGTAQTAVRLGDTRNPVKSASANKGLRTQRARQDAHSSEKSREKDICFKCGKPGHFRRDCPQGEGFKRGMMAAVEQQRQLHHQLLAAAADSGYGQEEQTSSPHQMGLLKGEYSDYSDSDSD